MRRPRPAVAVLAASCTALVVGMSAIAAAGSPAPVTTLGERPGVAAYDGRSSSQGSDTHSLEASPRSTSSSVKAGGDRRKRVDATQLPTRDLSKSPRYLAIPSLGVSAPVDRVGVTSDGLVEVPEDVGRVGWYKHSQVAGAESGSIVVVGHRDGVSQGAGAFYSLGKLVPGDTVVLTLESGQERRYEVVSRESFSKGKAPLDELFSRRGPARLTLITCGGPFDSSTLGYTDNIVVTAVPLSR